MKQIFCAVLLCLVLEPAVQAQDQRVVVMTSYPQELINRYESAFESAHPDIDMVLEWRRSDDARQLLEAGSADVDVYWAPTLDTFVTLADAGYFAALPLPFAGLPGRIGALAIDDPQQRFAAFEVAGFGFAFSRPWLDQHGLAVPQDWTDLDDPHYADSVLVPVPSRQGFSPMIYQSILAGYGWERGWALITAIAARNTLMGNGGGAFIDALADASAGLALSIDFFPKSAQMNGQAVDFRYANTTLLSPAYVAVLAAAPHPAAARAFMDFVLSDPGQALLLNRDVARLPVRPSAYDDSAPFNPFAADVTVPAFDFQQAGAWQVLVSTLFDVQISARHAVLAQAMASLDKAIEQAANDTVRQELVQARQQLTAPALDTATALQLLHGLQSGELTASDLPQSAWAHTLELRLQQALALAGSVQAGP